MYKYEPHEIKLYVNGELVGTKSLGSSPTPIAINNHYLTSMNLGRSSSATITSNIKIDDARIFRRALTAEEVMALFTDTAEPPPAPASNPQELLAAKSGGYRYGFNGKEKDDEVSGNGNIFDYGFRIYNPRLGKFLSVDPLSSKFPYYSPFQFAGNKPIVAIDLDGLEEYWSHSWTESDGSVKSQLVPLRNADGSPHAGNQMGFNDYCRRMGINTSVIPSDAIVASHDDYINGVDIMRGYVVQNFTA